MPLFLPIFRDVAPPSQVSQEVDVLNQRFCPQGATFDFGLTQDAEVTLEFRTIDAIETDGTPIFGNEIFAIDEEDLSEGDISVATESPTRIYCRSSRAREVQRR